jgi:DNA-binding response OmpR family regulator
MYNMNENQSSRILVIDDDIDLLMLLERRLQKEGFDVETAASLQEAQEIIPLFLPNLVLLDINVNGEDGRKLCWELKNAPSPFPVKVLMMSGFDFSQGRAILFGADELLPKPFNTEYLLLRVEELLKQQVGNGES